MKGGVSLKDPRATWMRRNIDVSVACATLQDHVCNRQRDVHSVDAAQRVHDTKHEGRRRRTSQVKTIDARVHNSLQAMTYKSQAVV